MKIIECVPNFSEGKDNVKIERIARVFASHPRVRLADYSSDPDHNRSVFTFLGEPDDVRDAALAAAGEALKLIDMRGQEGAHPRLGAVDVVPFIPLAQAVMKDAVAAAREFGRIFFEKFGVPVYFYGAAALKSNCVELPDVRRGGYETLTEKINCADTAPDIGAKINERAGATIVGAREILVAFNINLASANLTLAQKIAAQIREKNGGLKGVRAIGVPLKSRKLAQVSINITNCRETPLRNVYDEVKKLADKNHVGILESELIGLAPACAFAGATPAYLKLKNFNENRLIETHLKKCTN
ncbi:MAG TPA: glutamate formimidoyltransferase [Smithellaceae bacterium]|nr:glutamate formimidoyltransferase [Smithellaceae bacterium]HRS88417.1 glutamate formimidoyltransferase [Smithellaceae bacterium]HRV25473.1 glutamate formimidoyltransferase [Smithellaceae bacterium]